MSEFRMNRRRFLGAGFVAASSAITHVSYSQAQVSSSGVSPSGRYEDVMIFERKPFTWPASKSLAVWVAPNVEVWSFETSADAALAPAGGPGPDVINYGTREYGIRVGLWRIADVLDELAIKATVALNSAVCEIYPRAVNEMKKRDWEFMGHGVTISRSLRDLSIDQEREVIRTCVRTVEQATGKRVFGWLSPGQLETNNTPDLLAELGVFYTGDWNNDDQPWRFKVRSGELYSLPYCLQVNDIDIFSRVGLTGPQYYRALIDQFDTLLGDSEKHPRVMGIPLHPFLAGAPANIKYLKQALQYMKRSDRVWFATGAEIVNAFRNSQS